MKYTTKIAAAVLFALIAALSLRVATNNNAPDHTLDRSTGTLAPALPTARGAEAVNVLKQHQLYESLAAAYQAARYQPELIGRVSAPVESAKLCASNPAKGFRAFFARDTIHIQPAHAGDSPWHWSVQFTGYGQGDTLQPSESVEPAAVDSRVEYRRGPLTEWYDNGPRGLEQGFTLTEPPVERAVPGAPLVVSMSLDTDLTPRLNEQADTVAFVNDAGQPIVQYAGLKAWDATGHELPAHMQLRAGGQLALLVDDANAQYPLTIDPLIFAETKLTASDAAAGDWFGISVAISGDTVVVGASEDNRATGSAYVFVHSSTGWSQQQKLTASDAAIGHEFGFYVGISGDTVVVGAPLSGGAAYVFVRLGTTWSEQAKLTGSDFSGFGYSVGISGDTVVVGADNEGSTPWEIFGAAYVFVRSGATWTEQQKLTASDAAAGDRFGNSVGISGDTVVVGAVYNDDACDPPDENCDSGSAYVFVRSGTTWTEQQKLTASDAAAGDRLGQSVGISGDTVVVGAIFGSSTVVNSGSAYVFVRSGTSWSEQAKLTASDAAAGDGFGFVGINGDIVVVGAPFDADAGINSGAAYVFVRSGTSWSEQAKLTASDPATGEQFGASVGISGDTVVAGAYYDNSTTGAAYVYDKLISADLRLSMSAAKTTAKGDTFLSYTLTVDNSGPNTANNVVVTDSVPSGTTFVSASANKGSLTTPTVGGTGIVTWSVGSMLSGDTAPAQIKVTLAVKGKSSVTNTATVTSDTSDPNTANNTATSTVSTKGK